MPSLLLSVMTMSLSWSPSFSGLVTIDNNNNNNSSNNNNKTKNKQIMQKNSQTKSITKDLKNSHLLCFFLVGIGGWGAVGGVGCGGVDVYKTLTSMQSFFFFFFFFFR